MTRGGRAACSLGTLLLAALTVHPLTLSGAQTPPPTFSVSVTEPYELVEEVGTTRRIGRAEIEARNARTLDEALRLIPGIYVRTGGDGTPRIDVRGFRSRQVLLLINGVLVNSTADGQFDPARISTNAIREIKVSYGSSSVLYGDNAMAAVIEITTVDDKMDTAVDVSAGTADQRGVGGRYARTLGRWSLMGTATGYTADAFRLPGSFVRTTLEDGGRRQNSDRDRVDVRGAVGYRRSSTIRSRPSGPLAREVMAFRRQRSPTQRTSSRRRHASNVSKTTVRRQGRYQSTWRHPRASVFAPGYFETRSARIATATTMRHFLRWTIHWSPAPSSRGRGRRSRAPVRWAGSASRGSAPCGWPSTSGGSRLIQAVQSAT